MKNDVSGVILDTRALAKLSKIVAGAGDDAVSDIARYVLEDDISRISHGRTRMKMPDDIVERAVAFNRVRDLVTTLLNTERNPSTQRFLKKTLASFEVSN